MASEPTQEPSSNDEVHPWAAEEQPVDVPPAWDTHADRSNEISGDDVDG